ncbi:Multidrug resistance-associated protein 1 [Trichostrongylus colubriformis]|uniref:ABC-type glutathione-S-conjugate transporter n=1 Tax=Trichostrongylus colubriformis TaxID=6319 RepID=A0AAN8EZ35_TRICO
MMTLASFRNIFCTESPEKIFDVEWKNNTSLQTVPQITECVQHLDLSWLPALFLIIFCPLPLYDLYRSEHARARCHSPVTYRILICVVLVIDLTCSFFYNAYNYFILDNKTTLKYMVGDCAQYIGLCLALTLMIACRNRGLVTSGVLFIYWLLMVICGLPEFRFLLERYFKSVIDDDFRFFMYLVYYPLICLELLLSCFADTPSGAFIGKQMCPELSTSFLNQITFHWFTGLAVKGYKKPLERDDLWALNERDRANHLIPQFYHYFKRQFSDKQAEQKQKPSDQRSPDGHPSILVPLFQTYKFSFISGALLKLTFDLLQFVAPALLRYLISFIQSRDQPLWFGICIASGMFIVAMIQSMILHQYFHLMFRLGMNIRSVLTSAVYSKAMHLSNNARKNRTTGEIVNLMSVDIQRLQDMTTFVMLFWSAPLQVILSIVFLWRILGVAVIAGLVILIAMVPINSYISVKMRNCQVQQMKYKDERLKMMSEVLNGIKVLKLYAWEKSMENAILNIRVKELNVLKKLAFLNAATTLSWACAPFLVAVLSFAVFVTIDPDHNILTPQVTFVALALFNILRFPLAIFAMIFSQAVQCHVSNKRLRAFFAEEEMDFNAVGNKYTDEAVKIENATFTWENGDVEETLKNITMTVERGQLVAIVGKVGVGKSSLLQAILGEMNKISGSVNVNGSIAYVPQQAWIQNLSLRSNILFNRAYDRTFYEKVLDACALRQDLASLPAEDMTEIGEKGINLSGGQKQRVSLARALYSHADIILLDDPLSAVDSHVGKHIFENVISSTTGILSHKTRILVTHGLHYLKYCDKVIVLKGGEISEMGTYRELIARQGAFSEFLEEFLVEETKKRGRSVSFGDNEEDVSEILMEMEKVSPDRRKRIESQMSQEATHVLPKHEKSPSPQRELSSPTSNGNVIPSQQDEEHPVVVGKGEEKVALLGEQSKPIQKSKLVEREAVETGKVKWTVYLTYIRAIGFDLAVLFVGVYILSSVLGVASNLWLAKWSDDAEMIQKTSNGSSSETNTRLAIYASLGVGQAVFVCAASTIMAFGMVGASRLLHEGILRNILRSPMIFFDVTPIGRILNRFGKDMEAIDTTLPGSIRSMLMTVFNVIATLVVIVIATPVVAIPFVFLAVFYIVVLDMELLDYRLPGAILTFIGAAVQAVIIIVVPIYATPPIIFILVPVFVFYFYILRFYVSTSRQLKRLESASRSPIYSHFQESIQGAASIRAYKLVDEFVKESERRVDENLATYYPSIVANRWLAVRLELVGNLIVMFSALFAVLFRDSPGLTAGLVGLSVSYALNITQTLNWAVRMTSELETNIVAVERIKEYTDTPIEGAHSKQKPADSWPQQGKIDIKNVFLRYRVGLEPVLKDVSVSIKPKEKIGIVGRTGAGKSSLTLALFRTVEIDSGSIEIDGENISKLSLEELRSRLTIVPQDPVLFSGTLRFNLDPFDAYSECFDSGWRIEDSPTLSNINDAVMK